MKGGVSAFQEVKEDMGETIRNVFTTVTGTAADATGLAKNTLGQTFKIGDQAVTTTGELATSGLKTASGVGVSTLDTTTDVTKAGLKTASQTGVGALGVVGDTAQGTFKGLSNLGLIVGNTGKGVLDRQHIKGEASRIRSAENTKYIQEKKTADNEQAIAFKKKNDTESRNARNKIMNDCYDDISSKQPPPTDYPLKKRSKHCQRMANCKIYGKQKETTKFWNKNCKNLKIKMGERVEDKDWLNLHWDNNWNYTTAPARGGGKNTRKKRNKKRRTTTRKKRRTTTRKKRRTTTRKKR